VAFLAKHLKVGQIAAHLARLPPADVYVAVACAAGEPAGQRELDARLRRVAKQALAGFRLGEVAVDELLQSVRSRLLVNLEEGGEGKLASYAGQGSLDGWLGITLARAALRSLRSHRPDAANADGEEAEAFERLTSAEDPQLAAIRERCGPLLKAAVERAFAQLPDEQRTLLRLHLIDRLTIDDLAIILHTHRATAARRLARARNAIIESARLETIAALGLDDSEFASLGAVLASQFDLTLARVLGGDGASPRRGSP
jgi:RNA polymerase sigma-70 factor (ECF subfamily)